MKLTHDRMYQAILEKDSSFEGIFYTGVKTTGIFCKPTCTARKPKKENVEFFTDSKTAILKGYRACKVCLPLNPSKQTPEFVNKILSEISSAPSIKLKDYDLVKRGIDPAKMRRWFLKNHGITFHAFQRMQRINTAFKKISTGAKISSVAYDSGFDSLSGFTESFKSIFGVAPSASKKIEMIDLTRIETPLGTMIACAVKEGICLLEFSDRKMLETELKDLSKRLNATIVQGQNSLFEKLEAELQQYFQGKLRKFSIPLVTPGTEFQQEVWNELLQIPYGQTRSYKQQAMALGNPEAVRAVARANGMNRIAILIPCHRVIGGDGKLTGYAGGIWRKQRLLDLESDQLSF
ncbi:bifunctional transcriptional activator/DNA repair enzyme AdaA [Algoriphagus namhaensis]